MLKVIKSRAEHEAARQELLELLRVDPDLGTEEGDRLELLRLLISDYEANEFPVSLPDPVTAIEFRMDQAGLKQKDLVPFIGSRSKVSEILSRKRTLSLSMIKALHTGLGIPAEVLIQDYDRLFRLVP
ncbi:MAG TPA: hypothetical protein VMO47_06325 [Rhodothermales bacterium]|nr:hypothetical protein [Rhodothermales bacterium]